MMFGAKLVSPEGKVIYQETISKHIRLEDRTFLSLAVGLSRAFSESMEEVREGVIMSVVE
jgi:hemerythrin-like domain-containing protein